MTETISQFQSHIQAGIPVELPDYQGRDESIQHAPVRNIDQLSLADRQLALRNALRYFPVKHHAILAPEFADELNRYGRIYMHRFRPAYPMHARPIDAYPAKSRHAAAIMLMIQNNLDPLVAKYPHELITYGGNGAVFQNWAQYLLTMKYLSEMSDEQTLVMYSGHPLGLFPSHSMAPRVVVTNGMMVPNYSSKDDWNTFNAIGVTQYGQMTAGSYMYIGPQGIVHGTTITLLNAGRLKGLGDDHLRGKAFVTSGLGGMSGAQARAMIITGATGIIAEVDNDAIQQRIADHYIRKEDVFHDVDALLDTFVADKDNNIPRCFVYHGNIVELWEKLADRRIPIELGSDQTSCHNLDGLGYCPAGYTFEEAKILLAQNKADFDEAVRASLRRHVVAINRMCEQGMYFWDYGNAFLFEAARAGADIKGDTPSGFRYPSYVEDIMGPMCFDYGFGPFRWVCTSGTTDDLYMSDEIAAQAIRDMLTTCAEEVKGQWRDNLNWIEGAKENIPLVGSRSRILYADAVGRIEIAKRFNQAIRDGVLKAPVVLGRDHHDVSGTDSPWRETANIYDGSKYTADMAIHNVIGDAMRGATWVSIHNGGGTGWGEAINGGFGLVLDGSEISERALQAMLFWDVNNGIARRAWARNPHAMSTAAEAMRNEHGLTITLPYLVSDQLIASHYKS